MNNKIKDSGLELISNQKCCNCKKRKLRFVKMMEWVCTRKDNIEYKEGWVCFSCFEILRAREQEEEDD